MYCTNCIFQVDRFFSLLRSLYIKHDLRPQDIYNCDETGIQTSGTRPPKVLSVKGKRQVGVVSSAERGKTVTALCCCSATGVFVPPALIFPRKRMIGGLLDGAPPGSIGLCSDSGWINTELFVQWLDFFIKHVKPSVDRPVLLILDNHESHRALSVIEKASENHVVLLSVPPHTTHKLQPLDRSVYGPFSNYFEKEIDKFQKEHPGRRIQMTDMGSLFGKAYSKACSVENAIIGFKKCGIAPFDANVFSDEDFAPASVTDRDMPNLLITTTNTHAPNTAPASTLNVVPIELPAHDRPATTEILPFQPATIGPNQADHSLAPNSGNTAPAPTATAMTPLNVVPIQLPDADVTTSLTPIQPKSTPATSAQANHTPSTFAPHTVLGRPTSIHFSTMPATAIPGPSRVTTLPSQILPLPKSSQPSSIRKRKTQHSEILTGSPFKKSLQEKENTSKRKRSAPAKKGSNKKTKKGPNKKAKNSSKKNKGNDVEQYNCIVCGELYVDPPTEDWIQCMVCLDWAHDDCTAYEEGEFRCDKCSF